MKIVDAQFVIVPPEDTEFAGHWDRLSIETRNAISANRFGFVYQVVIKAVTKESAGKGVTLMSLPVDAQQGYAISKYGVKEAFKNIVRSIMSSEVRYRLRRIARSLGMRM